jgi:hypothetical protein
MDRSANSPTPAHGLKMSRPESNPTNPSTRHRVPTRRRDGVCLFNTAPAGCPVIQEGATQMKDGKSKKVREGARVARSQAQIEWRRDEIERKNQAESGVCVVANMRGNGDPALVAWAKETGHFVRIDRATAWGNPFEMPDDGDRDAVCDKFAQHYFPHKNGLQSQLQQLRGKVLGCWCSPERCHGHFIAEAVNGEIDLEMAGFKAYLNGLTDEQLREFEARQKAAAAFGVGLLAAANHQ